MANLDRASGYSVSSALQVALSWPTSLPDTQRERAQQAFAQTLASMTHAADVVRAAAVLIGAARAAPDCSPFAQVGISWQQGQQWQARYLDGHADDIAALTNDDIGAHWEMLATE